MRLQNISLIISLLILSSCIDKVSSPIGEWNMYDMEYQTGYKSVLMDVTSDFAWQNYIDQYGNEQIKKEYKNLSESDKKKMREIVRHKIDLQGKESFRKFTDGAFISLNDDNTFSFYFYPYYIDGKYIITNNDIDGSISKIVSVLYNENRINNYSNEFKLTFQSFKNNDAFIIESDDFPSIWKLDTLYVKKNKNQSIARTPSLNQWRFHQENLKEKLQAHLEYIITIFNDAIKNEQKSININSELHCSPLKFYGNGIAIKDVDSEEIKCWKSLFDSEKDFLRTLELLTSAFRENAMKKNDNKFKRNIDFINKVKNSL